MPKENLPNGVVVHCHNKGWMDRDIMAVWGEKVWRPRPVSFFNRTSLLIFDSFSAHIDRNVHKTFKTEHKTLLLIGRSRTMFVRSGRSGCLKEFTPSLKLER